MFSILVYSCFSFFSNIWPFNRKIFQRKIQSTVGLLVDILFDEQIIFQKEA